MRGRGLTRGPERERQERDGRAPALRLQGHRHRSGGQGGARRGVRRSDWSAHRRQVRGGSMNDDDPPPPTMSGVAVTLAPPSDTCLPRGIVLKGIPGSPGVVVGLALVVGDTRTAYGRRHVPSAQIEAEVERLHRAVEDAKRNLREVSARIPAGPLETNAILDAYLMMVGDPMLLERVVRKIRDEKKCAEWAVAQASDEIAKLFAPADSNERDAYIAERGHDIEFVCDRLLRELTGDMKQIVPRLDQPVVIIGRDLSPADTAGMVREPVIAFITEIGTRTSHTAIMARALEIPAVVGVADALSLVRTGDTLIVDGLRGEVVVSPNAATRSATQRPWPPPGRPPPWSAWPTRSRSFAPETRSSSTGCAARSWSARTRPPSKRRGAGARSTWRSRAGSSPPATSPASPATANP